jgi:peptidoglycan/xylan/chitin deacetylase (PgdA/CDA1 family)
VRLFKLIIGGVVATATAALLPTVSANAVSTNLIGNPSAELAAGSQPANWTFSKWGTNQATQSWKTGGLDGQKSLAITMTSRSSGDAKWMSAPVTVAPKTKYTVSDWYIANVKTTLEAVYTTAAGKETYVWLADAPVSAAWKQVSATFTTPADAAKISVYHVLEAKGTLQTDVYSLAESAQSGTPPPTPPTISLSAPADGAKVTGSQQVAATVSADVTSVSFQLDGADLGAADTSAPFAVTWDTTKSANGVHTVKATAHTAAGQSASAEATVTVTNGSTPPPSDPPPTNPPPATGNLIANPSVETGATTPTGWTGEKWGTNTTAFTYLSTGHTGSHSVEAQITAYTSGDAKWAPTPVAVTPGKTYQYTSWYQSNVDTELDVEVTMSNGTAEYAYLAGAPAASAWTKLSAQYTVPAGATKISVMQVLAKKGWVIGDDFSLTEYAPAHFSEAMVSLTFDDGWRSGYTNGVPLLDKYHMPATFYLLTSTTTYPDYMTQAQMGELATHGDEIASHTVTHPHLPTLTAAQIDAEMKNSQTTLRQWYGPTVAKNFATPYGEYNATVLADAKKYYRSHRSTDEGYNTKDSTDFNNIKVQNILNTTTPAQVAAWVDQAVLDKSWLVIVYHEVSTTAEDPTYSVTPANLEAELKAIQARAIAVRTVDQALDEIAPQL